MGTEAPYCSEKLKMSHVYRLHSQLKAGIDGPIVGNDLLHLKQSDIDSACGPHCALMALLLMQQCDRSELENINKTKNQQLAKFWRLAEPLYFTGSRPKQLLSLFKPYEQHINSYSTKNKSAKESAQIIRADGLSIVAIRSGDFDHWVLCVGVGRKEGSDDDTLFVIDPDLPAIQMSPWNSTLTVSPNRNGRHRYETPHGTWKVSVDHAILLLPNIDELELDLQLD